MPLGLPHKFCLILLVGVIAGGREARAQAGSYDDPAQVAALDAYASQQAGTLAPEDYVQLSRLLSSPSDQVRWLTAIAEDWTAKGMSAESAALSKRIQERMDAWAGRNIPGLDFAPLRERLAKLQPKATESDMDKKVARALEKAYFPGGRVAEPWILLDQDKSLAAAATEAPEASWLVGRALLRLALGMLPEDSNPVTWAAIAQDLDNHGSTAWAALARLVQAACSNDASEQQALLGRAREGLKSPGKTLEEAAGRILSAVARCEQQAPLEEGFFPPLAFELTGAQRRAAIEQEFKREWAGGNKEAIFKAMQTAKAAEIGLEAVIKTLSMADLKRGLGGNFPRTHLFVEMLQVEQRYYALVVGSRFGSLDNKDEFVETLVGPEAGLTELLTKAQAACKLGPQSKILIAVDGEARTAAGLRLVTGALKDHFSAGGEPSFIEYMPSAGALEKSCWTMRRATRWWALRGFDDGRFFDYVGNRDTNKQDRPPSPGSIMLANFSPKQPVRALSAWTVDKVIAELKKNEAARSHALLLVSEEPR